jgi:hypothetical protein
LLAIPPATSSSIAIGARRAEVAIVGSGPQELAGSRVDEPRRDPQARDLAAQAAPNQVIDLDAAPEFGGIVRGRLGEAGLAR